MKNVRLILILLIIISLILNMEGCKKKENSPPEQISLTREKDANLPALSEKDVKLIEAFIHEMNLLVELQRANSEIFKYQFVQLNAAYSDLDSLGNDNTSIFIMRYLAYGLILSYDLANLIWNASDPDFKEYEKIRDEASLRREKFIKTYQMLLHGTTINEINDI